MPRDSRKTDGRPSWQWYPSDWLSEPGLKLCDLAARGLWIDLLCNMFTMENRGELTVLEKHLGSKEIAALVGREVSEVEAALKQLIEWGVCEKSDEGCIYNRRMVRDEKQRRSKAEAGSKGGRVSKPPKSGSRTEAKQGPSSSTPTSSSLSSSTPTAKEAERN